MKAEDFRKPRKDVNESTPEPVKPKATWPESMFKKKEPVNTEPYAEEFFGSSPQEPTAKPVFGKATVTSTIVDRDGNPVNPTADRRWMDDTPLSSFFRQAGSWYANIPTQLPKRQSPYTVESVIEECKFLRVPSEDFETMSPQAIDYIKERALKQINDGYHCKLTLKIGCFGGWWFTDAGKIKDIIASRHFEHCWTCHGEIIRMRDFHPHALESKLQKLIMFSQAYITGSVMKSVINAVRR